MATDPSYRVVGPIYEYLAAKRVSKFLPPALNNCERFSSSSGRVVVVVVVVVEVALVVVVLVVVGVVVVVLIFVRNYLNLYKVRVERAVPETRRGVSAPDFAVGADARVHNG